ncbi:MAG: type II secretion system F family protein [Candidatus Moranbacteria bacterium]|nr:type II secretion system F family protein [Candidatus Moranbacteria bacterium]
MKFSFRAKSLLGDVREGHVEATSRDAAATMLQGKGLVPISIEQQKEVPNFIKNLQHLWEGINLREVAVFFRQMSTLIEAKVSIISSMRAVADQTENIYLRTVIWDMVDDLEDGMPLSESMAKHSDVFEPLAISMIKAGELSGNLERSISFLADNAEKNYDLNSKIRGALFYPAFVLSAAVIIGFVVFTNVLPKLTAVFKDLKAEVPWYTKTLMNTGDFMSQYWWVVLVFILIIISGVAYYIHSEDGRREWDVIKMKIPLIGNIFKYVYLARFSENLSVLLSGGIPIVRALTIISSVVNSTAYESVILRAADEVKKGGTMSSVFARSPYFPPIVAQMIKIGEDSGRISEVLNHIAIFYGKETDRITRNLSTMLEPILISFLGLGVAILVFSILIPIYNLSSIM